MRASFFRAPRMVVAVAASLAVAAWIATAASAAPGGAGALYTATNAASGNAVLIFDRAAHGTLTAAGSVATGGLGSGGGLGNQGGLVLSDDGQSVFVVDAGSNEISALAVRSDGLELVGKVSSGGVGPLSLTVSGDLLYVLNAGGGGSAANISGFRIEDGALAPIAGSTRPLSGASVGPAELAFDPGGHVLAVTEKGTSLIDTYTVGADGVASGPSSQPSAGTTPFGFAFDKRGHLIVSDAFGGAPGAGALSSYAVASDGTLATISGVVGDGQGAPCWVVTTKNGRYAYTSNTGSGSISSYSIGHDGSVVLLSSIAGSTGAGSAPIDMALSGNSHYLYALDSGTHAISVFRVESDGSLAALGSAGITGLPASTNGLAAS